MFKYLKRRFMPPCGECKYHQKGLTNNSTRCVCPSVVKRLQQISCGMQEFEYTAYARGTFACKFEEKGN